MKSDSSTPEQDLAVAGPGLSGPVSRCVVVFYCPGRVSLLSQSKLHFTER